MLLKIANTDYFELVVRDRLTDIRTDILNPKIDNKKAMNLIGIPQMYN